VATAGDVGESAAPRAMSGLTPGPTFEAMRPRRHRESVGGSHGRHSVLTLAAGLGAVVFAITGYHGARVADAGSVSVARTAVDQSIPDDTPEGPGWASVQWNFAAEYGVDAPIAWGNLIAAGAPGGSGVTVAVLDTGVSSSQRSPAPGSPELAAGQVVPGWDFVDGDADPTDENGHGTQVASMIAEDTNTGFGQTGLAYGAKIMPVRVFDSQGVGDVDTIARGVRFAAEHGAKVINLSFAFGPSTTEADIAPLVSALDFAAQRGVLSVGASGNEGIESIDLPARSRNVLAVGATTEFGCVAAYSNYGRELDLVAPGGGTDAPISDKHCKAGRRGRGIDQLDRFGNRYGVVGTSMAVPHVAAAAALVVAGRIVGTDPSPAAIETRLERTARDLGAPGYDERYGWGLVSAGAATTSTTLVSRAPSRRRQWQRPRVTWR